LGALIQPVRPPLEERKTDTAAIEFVRPNPYQPRTIFSEQALQELAASIREKGLLQPLLVRRRDDHYELIAGERRLRAAQLAGLREVPITIRDGENEDSLELALIENLQRENLNPIEEARAFQRLVDGFGLTQEQIATRVGKQRSTIANALRLLSLPAAVQEQIESGVISAGHARALLGLVGANEQAAMARSITELNLSVRDTERAVRLQSPPPPNDPDCQAMEDELARSFGTRVRIKQARNGSGRIEIHYHSMDALNGLLERLRRAESP
jgi:ParB family chromosome partitioning protein